MRGCIRTFGMNLLGKKQLTSGTLKVWLNEPVIFKEIRKGSE